MPEPRPRRDRLRTELARLRIQAGLSGRQLGAALGAGQAVKQATISRIERGETVPSVPTVRAWLHACGVGSDAAVQILDLAEAAQAETRGWRELLDRDGHAQHESAEMERAAVSVRNVQPTVVPGLLQTPEYAHAVLSIGRTRDVAAAVAARMNRQQRLYEPGRRFTFLIAEQVLAWPVGGREVLAVQLDRIVSLSRLPAVEIAVLPADATVATLWNNFILWKFPDEPPRVTAERTDGETDTSDADSVVLHEQLWSRLWDAAAQGEAAIELIRGI